MRIFIAETDRETALSHKTALENEITRLQPRAMVKTDLEFISQNFDGWSFMIASLDYDRGIAALGGV